MNGATQAVRAGELSRLMLDATEADAAAAYNLLVAQRVARDIDLGRLAEALTRVVRSRAVTRVRVWRAPSGAWMQADSGLELPPVRVERLAGEGAWSRVRREVSSPFPVPGGPYFRVRLVEAEGEGWLFLGFHHAFCDSRSVGALLREVLRAYDEPAWNPPPDGYFEWAARDAIETAGPRGEAGRRFWRAQEFDPCAWPCAPRLGNVPGETGSAGLRFQLPISLAALRAAAQEFGVTVNTLLVGALARAIAVDHGAGRAFLGCVCHARTKGDNRVFGLLFRDLGFAIETDGENRAYLRRVWKIVREGIAHRFGSSEGALWRDSEGTGRNITGMMFSEDPLPPRLFQPDSRAVYGDAGEAHDALAIPMYCDGNAVRVEFTYRRETYCAARIAEFRDLFVETLVGLAGA